MHFSKHKIGKHHLENYGHPSEFGYHNFVPQFKAEQFATDKSPSPLSISNVSILGSNQGVEWKLTDSGLTLNSPLSTVNDLAVVYKIETR